MLIIVLFSLPIIGSENKTMINIAFQDITFPSLVQILTWVSSFGRDQETWSVRKSREWTFIPDHIPFFLQASEFCIVPLQLKANAMLQSIHSKQGDVLPSCTSFQRAVVSQPQTLHHYMVMLLGHRHQYRLARLEFLLLHNFLSPNLEELEWSLCSMDLWRKLYLKDITIERHEYLWLASWQWSRKEDLESSNTGKLFLSQKDAFWQQFSSS